MGAAVVIITLSRLFAARRRRRAHREQISAGRRCLRCGYSMENLGVPRCPECGALYGFRQTMSELGVTEGELRNAARRKRPHGGRESEP